MTGVTFPSTPDENKRKENIDHTIDMNPGFYLGPSSLELKNCTIWASHKSWGDCIRIFYDVLVNVDQCTFYRAPGGEKPDPGHTGIHIAASEKIGANITNNTFNHGNTYGAVPKICISARSICAICDFALTTISGIVRME